MYAMFDGNTVTSVLEMVCYAFTFVAALVSCMVSLRC